MGQEETAPETRDDGTGKTESHGKKEQGIKPAMVLAAAT